MTIGSSTYIVCEVWTRGAKTRLVRSQAAVVGLLAGSSSAGTPLSAPPCCGGYRGSDVSAPAQLHVSIVFTPRIIYIYIYYTAQL